MTEFITVTWNSLHLHRAENRKAMGRKQGRVKPSRGLPPSPATHLHWSLFPVFPQPPHTAWIVRTQASKHMIWWGTFYLHMVPGLYPELHLTLLGGYMGGKSPGSTRKGPFAWFRAAEIRRLVELWTEKHIPKRKEPCSGISTWKLFLFQVLLDGFYIYP